jgi:hypothetical protein
VKDLQGWEGELKGSKEE